MWSQGWWEQLSSRRNRSIDRCFQSVSSSNWLIHEYTLTHTQVRFPILVRTQLTLTSTLFSCLKTFYPHESNVKKVICERMRSSCQLCAFRSKNINKQVSNSRRSLWQRQNGTSYNPGKKKPHISFKLWLRWAEEIMCGQLVREEEGPGSALGLLSSLF